MAIQQDTRQVTAQPSNRLIREFRTQLPTPDMSGVANLSRQVGAIAQDEMKTQAVDEVNLAVESLKFGKNEDGSYTKPPAPEEWGSFKRQYFDELVNKRYTNDVLLDHDTSLAKIYADTKASGGDPSAAFAKAQADLTGRLQGVDPSLRGTVELGMRKQVQQYNTGFITSWGTKAEESNVKGVGNQISLLSEQYVKAQRDGNDAEATSIKGRIDSLRTTLKTGGRLTANPDEEKSFWNSLNIESAIKKSINVALSNPDTNKAEFAKEMDKLRLIVGGTSSAEETAFGLTRKDFDNVSPNVITGLHRELGMMSDDFRRVNSVSEQMQQIQRYLQNVRNGVKFQTADMSDKTIMMSVSQHIQDENQIRAKEQKPPINPDTPEGMAWIFNNHGFIPGKMYDHIFSGMSTLSVEKVERAATLYEAAKSGTESGRSAPYMDQIASAEDRIFLESYLNLGGRRGGTTGSQTLDDIKNVIETNRTISETKNIESEILPLARRALGNDTLTIDEMRKKIGEKSGLDIKNMNSESQKVFFDKFQKVFYRMQGDLAGAASISAQTFKQFYTQDPLSIAQKEQMKFSGNTFISKERAFPIPLDGTNQPVANWVNGYIGSIAEKYMEPARDKDGKPIQGSIKVTGIGSVDINDLEAGRNVFFKSTGRGTYDPSVPWHQQQGVNPSFQVWYFDPVKNKGSIPTLLTVKGTNALLEVYPHAEAKAQHDSFAEASRTGNIRVNQIIQNDAIMAQQRRRTQSAALAGREQDIPTFKELATIGEKVKPIFYDTRGRVGVSNIGANPPAVSDLGVPIMGADETFQAPRGASLYRVPNPDNLISTDVKRLIESQGNGGTGRVRPGANLMNTRADLVDFGRTLVSEFGGLDLTSGRRAAGGQTASTSQHVTGNALDFSVKGMSTEDKAKLVQRVIADDRVGGFGYYPNSDSIHIDFRTGPKTAWGQNKSHTSLPNTPDWFRLPIEQWRKG